MCVLVLLHRCVEAVPIVVGANRDEAFDRAGAPPGLRLAGDLRALAPRDRRAGGTWLGFNERGVFAALTNRPGDVDPARASRGEIVPLALSRPTAAEAKDAVLERMALARDNPFRILLTDGRDAFVAANDGSASVRLAPGLHWLSNEHGLDPFPVPSLGDLAQGKTWPTVEAGLRRALRDHGVHGNNHRFCRHGETRGTVSSSIVCIPEAGPTGAEFWFAQGRPCETEYHRYSNLTKRLHDDADR